MEKSRADLIKELIDIKMDGVVEQFGMDSLHRNYNNYYEKFRSDAEYEVDIGVYPPKEKK